MEKFGGLHVAFNNAGAAEISTIVDITLEATSKMIDVNFKSLVFCFKYQVKRAHDLRILCRMLIESHCAIRFDFSSQTVPPAVARLMWLCHTPFHERAYCACAIGSWSRAAVG